MIDKSRIKQHQKESRRLKMHIAISIALTIPIVILSLPHLIPTQLGNFIPMDIRYYRDYIMLALATPLQFWIGSRFYRGLWNGIKAKTLNIDTFIVIGTTAVYIYSAMVTIISRYLLVYSDT
jgi:Cu+-exporting ATPase